MNRPRDPRIDDAKAMTVTEVVDKLGIEGLTPHAWELVGPCPKCGGVDRFAIHLRKKLFLCRKCMPEGGDMIKLAQEVLGLPFSSWDAQSRTRSFPVLDALCGPAVQLSPEEIERRARRREKDEKARAAAEERARRASIAAGRAIWAEGLPPAGTDVERYLARRGLEGILADLTPCLRFHPALPYMIKEDGRWIEIDRRPAMLAALQAPDGRFCCVHRTWLDLDQPNGKAVIHRDGRPAVDAKGRPLKSKKTLGSTKGAAIRLITPSGPWDTLVMGEGIETTLTAACAGAVPGAAYWAGVDLGNMAGRMAKVPGRRWSGLPDMNDARAFVPPPWVRRELYIQDGDSDPTMTRAKLECGLRRAMAAVPGLQGQIVHPGAGVDLNDVIRPATPPRDKETSDD